MAKGTVLAEIALSGDRSFRRAVESSGEKMDGAARDASTLSAILGLTGRALEDARDKGLSLASSLYAMQSAADEAEDEISDAGRAAVGTSGTFSSLALTTDGAALSFGTLSTVTMLSLVPSLITLGSVLVPLVGALGGFVGVMASIAGVGVGLGIAALATEMQFLKDTVATVVEALKNILAPVGFQVANAFAYLAHQVPAVVEAMLPTEQVLSRLLGNFVQLGQEVLQVLPALAKVATELTLQFLPAIVDLADKYLPKLPGLLTGMAGVLSDVAPLLAQLGTALVELGPTALEFGMNVLTLVVPAIVDLIGILGQGMAYVNGMEGAVQDLTLGALALAPVLFAVGSALAGLSAPVLAVIGVIGALAAAYATNFAGIRDTVNKFAAQAQRILGDRLPALIDAVSAAWETWKPIIVPIVDVVAHYLGTVLVNALDAVLSIATAVFQFLSGDFSGAAKTIADLWVRNFTRIAEFFNKFTNGALEDLANDAISFINTLGKTLDEFLGHIGMGGKMDFQAFQQVDIGTTPFSAGSSGSGTSRRPPGGRGHIPGAPGGEQRVDVNVEVGVNDDGEIETYVDERITAADRMKAKKTRLQ